MKRIAFALLATVLINFGFARLASKFDPDHAGTERGPVKKEAPGGNVAGT